MPHTHYGNVINLPFIIKTNDINLKCSVQQWHVEKIACTQLNACLSSSVYGLIINALC